jgi:hypothetical protein
MSTQGVENISRNMRISPTSQPTPTHNPIQRSPGGSPLSLPKKFQSFYDWIFI